MHWKKEKIVDIVHLLHFIFDFIGILGKTFAFLDTQRYTLHLFFITCNVDQELVNKSDCLYR